MQSDQESLALWVTDAFANFSYLLDLLRNWPLANLHLEKHNMEGAVWYYRMVIDELVDWRFGKVFGILLQIHQKILAWVGPPALIGNARIFTAPISEAPP